MGAAGVVDRARALLGRTFHGHGVDLMITEVEAYGGIDDRASHAFTRTPRSEIMYGPPWRLYVYRSYGIHHCVNIVTGPTEEAAAVLLRAGRVIAGGDLARARRGQVHDDSLARGPGNLSLALGVDLKDLGTDVLGSGQVRLGDVGPGRIEISSGPRVGVSQEADRLWRFWITGERTVSAYRRSPGAPAARSAH